MRIRIRELKSGMVLGRDLHDRGRILLREGATLSAAVIQTLQSRGLKAVDVRATDDLVSRGGVPAMTLLGQAADSEYLSERKALEELFADIGQADSQMQTLKYCIFQQLEEDYHDQGR